MTKITGGSKLYLFRTSLKNITHGKKNSFCISFFKVRTLLILLGQLKFAKTASHGILGPFNRLTQVRKATKAILEELRC